MCRRTLLHHSLWRPPLRLYDTNRDIRRVLALHVYGYSTHSESRQTIAVLLEDHSGSCPWSNMREESQVTNSDSSNALPCGTRRMPSAMSVKVRTIRNGFTARKWRTSPLVKDQDASSSSRFAFDATFRVASLFRMALVRPRKFIIKSSSSPASSARRRPSPARHTRPVPNARRQDGARAGAARLRVENAHARHEE